MGAREKATVAAESFNKRSKDKHFRNQYQTVYQSFLSSPKTMLQVKFETGVMRESICRYVATMRKEDNIQMVRKGKCPISKRNGVGFYTTNKKLFNHQQLTLFGDGRD
jgi:hypothetical protein